MATDSFLTQVFQSPVLAVRIAAWVISVLLIWVLVAFPARWLWSIMRDADFRLAAWLPGLRSALTSWKQARFEAFRTQLGLLIDEAAIQSAFEESGVMRTALAAPIQNVLDSAKTLLDTDSPLQSQEEGMSRLSKDLSRSRAAAGSNLAALDEQLDHEFRHHSSRSRLIVSLCLLAVIIPVNAVMLSQILTETGLLPRVVEGLPFPPSYPVAVVLTMIEAALGWVYHATASRRPSERGLPRRFSFLQAGLVLATIGAASVEGFFYGIVAAPKSGEAGLVLELGSFTVEARYIFAAWGVLIVVVLCGLAAAATAAWFDRVESTALKQLGTQLENIKKAFDRLDARSNQAQQKWLELTDLAAKCRRTLGVSDDVSFLKSAVDALRHDLLMKDAAKSGTTRTELSSSTEALSARLSLFLGLIFVVWPALATTGSFVIGNEFPAWPDWLNWASAACIGVPCIVVGMLLQPRVLYLKDTSHGLQALTPTSNRGLAIVAAISVGVVGAGAIVMRPASTVGTLIVLSTGVGLALLVREVSPTLAFVPNTLSRWRVAAVFAIAFGALAIASLAQWLLAVATWILRVLAQPSFGIVGEAPVHVQQPSTYV
jgi:hypothetical protein